MENLLPFNCLERRKKGELRFLFVKKRKKSIANASKDGRGLHSK